jgi:hypothetical protein
VDYTSAYLASLLAGGQYVQQATAQLGAASASVASSVTTSYGDQALQQEAAADSALVAQLQALLSDAQAQLAAVANRSAQVEAALDLQAAVFTQVFADAGGPWPCTLLAVVDSTWMQGHVLQWNASCKV